jgi:tetratricopeptide (TPR) repeat protein
VRRTLVVLLPALAALAVWLPSLRVGFLYDDFPLIVLNRSVHQASDVRAVLLADPTRPLLSLSWALNHAVAGLVPWPWHLVNVAVHALNAALVAALAAALARAREEEEPGRTGLFAGLLFAVTPMAAETVAYVASRSTALCSTFMLASLLAALPALQGARRRLVPTFTFFLLALATKEEAAALPILVILVDLLVVARGDLGAVGRRWRIHLPLALVPLLGLVARRAVAGAWLPEPHYALGAWVVAQLAAFPGYLGRAAVPLDPALFRATPPPTWPPGTSTGVLAAVGIALLAGALVARRRWPQAALAVLWMAACLAPSSTLVVLKEVVVDHRAYLGALGVLALGGRFLAGAGRLPFAIALLAGLTARSVHVQAVLADPVRLWEDAVRRAPWSVEARYELAQVYAKVGDPRGEMLMQAIPRLAPRDPTVWAYLASYLAERDRLAEAATAMESAVALAPRDARLRNNLGNLYARLERRADAIRELEAAVAGEPPLAQPRLDLARLLLDDGRGGGDRERARALVEEAARMEIDAVDARSIEELRGKLR